MVVELKKWSIRYLHQYVYVCNHVDRTYLTGRMPKPYTVEDGLWFIRSTKKLDGKQGIYRAIVVDDQCIGEISIVLQDDIYERMGTLGYYLLDEYKNQGIATNAIKEICDIAFKTLPINRIGATTFEQNLASRRVLEKNGFELEGILKNNLFKNSQISNECIYGKYREGL